MPSVKRNRNFAPEFAQMSDLCLIFGVSSQFFKDRIKLGLLRQNVYFFNQKIKQDAAKSVVLWDIAAIRQFIKANPIISGDAELDEFLSRAKI